MDKFKNWLNRKLPPGSFVRNVVVLMTGTTFSQALLVLIAPILTRLYTPEDFGVFALYTSILGILSVIACLRYELAIVLPEKDEDAANLLVLSIIICFFTSFVTLVIVAFFHEKIALLLGSPQISFWLWFLPLSLFLTGVFQALNYWSTRRKQFKRLAVRQITQNSVTAVTQIGAGFSPSSAGAGGLIGGYIAGQAVATSRLGWKVWKEEKGQFYKKINKRDIRNLIFLYKNFPCYTLWANLLNVASNMIPPILLGYFFNPVVVGFYALGHRVLNVPMNLIGGAVAQVFFPKANESKQTENLAEVTLELFKQLVSLGLVPIMLIAISAPELFALIFGEQWREAGEYVRYLSIWIFFQFISSPISTVYFVLNKQVQLLIFNIILFISRLAILLGGGKIGDILLTIKLLGIVGGVIYLGFCVYILKITGVIMKNVYSYLIVKLLQSLPFIILPLIVLILLDDSYVFVLAAVFSGLVFLWQEGRKLRVFA